MENRATLFVLKSDGKYVSGVTPLGVITTTDELARAIAAIGCFAIVFVTQDPIPLKFWLFFCVWSKIKE